MEEPRSSSGSPDSGDLLDAGSVADGASELLRTFFRHRHFRPGQRELIQAVLAGRDALGILPTGGGKSLTFALPGRLLGGTTIVFSPLVALMRNQVEAMTARGLRASLLSSDLTTEERRARIARIVRGAMTSSSCRPRRSRAPRLHPSRGHRCR